MRLHTFRVVYIVKELDSHAKHGQSLKKTIWTYNGFVQVSESFVFDRGSYWRKRWWNCLYGHFSRKNAPAHTSTGARVRARPSTRSAARYSLGENVSKKVCFWLWGENNLVQLPEEPSVTWMVDAEWGGGGYTANLKYFFSWLFALALTQQRNKIQPFNLGGGGHCLYNIILSFLLKY